VNPSPELALFNSAGFEAAPSGSAALPATRDARNDLEGGAEGEDFGGLLNRETGSVPGNPRSLDESADSLAGPSKGSSSVPGSNGEDGATIASAVVASRMTAAPARAGAGFETGSLSVAVPAGKRVIQAVQARRHATSPSLKSGEAAQTAEAVGGSVAALPAMERPRTGDGHSDSAGQEGETATGSAIESQQPIDRPADPQTRPWNDSPSTQATGQEAGQPDGAPGSLEPAMPDENRPPAASRPPEAAREQIALPGTAGRDNAAIGKPDLPGGSESEPDAPRPVPDHRATSRDEGSAAARSVSATRETLRPRSALRGRVSHSEIETENSAGAAIRQDLPGSRLEKHVELPAGMAGLAGQVSTGSGNGVNSPAFVDQITPESGGMPAASQQGQMPAKTLTANQTPASPARVLPRDDRSAPESAEAVGLETEVGEVDEFFRAGSHDFQESFRADSETPRGVGAAAKLRELARQDILFHALQLKDLGRGRLDVRLNADEETTIALHLRIVEGEIVVEARLEQGGHPDLLNDWQRLQRSLARDGVHLRELELTPADRRDDSDRDPEAQGRSYRDRAADEAALDPLASEAFAADAAPFPGVAAAFEPHSTWQAWG